MTAGHRVRLGLVGCGWIARNRLRQIADDGVADVVLIADTDPGVAEYASEVAPGARLVDALSDDDLGGLDGVMISTPSALHCDQAAKLLEQGVPVFVQKPLALSAGDARRLMALAAAADLPLDTDLCYRHLNSAVAVRRALQSSAIGTPFAVEGCFHNAYRPGSGWSHDPALAGGGALVDLGIHLMDLVMWLTGQALALEGTRLLRDGRPRRSGEVEDFATADLSLPDGAPVRLAASWDASTGRDAEIRLRIHGGKGCLEVANRNGSFFDFDAFQFHGTRTEHLAEDRGDAWQAGPLKVWLARVADGSGYRKPLWADGPLALVEQAYGRERDAPTPRRAAGAVHVVGRKGVLQ